MAEYLLAGFLSAAQADGLVSAVVQLKLLTTRKSWEVPIEKVTKTATST